VSAGAHGEPLEPFFLPAARGERFCIYHPAAGGARGGIVYLHPFAEEMNKSRRMAALQSRMFAARGFAVLQIDLFGCGDSSGEFGEARWELWKEDVALAVAWLRQRAVGAIHLWGLRLGAMLALDFAAGCGETFGGYLLWQPVVSGEAYLTQFLRLRVATEMIADGAATTGTRALRDELNAGAVLEVAGYELAPQLARAIDGLKLAELAPRGAPAHWLEVVAESGRPLPPAARRVADRWIAGSVELNVHCVAGEPFWNTLEITDSPALLEATMRAMGQG
jgi:exosortase A-associated hydrolase 2